MSAPSLSGLVGLHFPASPASEEVSAGEKEVDVDERGVRGRRARGFGPPPWCFESKEPVLIKRNSLNIT